MSDLPFINACLNSLATVLLVTGWCLIRAGRRRAHAACMISAFLVSTVFLACYLYHKYAIMKGVHTPWPGPAGWKLAYTIMLISHIVLAMAIVPMAFLTMSRALRERFDAHRRIARWTLPIWLYVSVTGVLIYVLLYRVWPPVVAVPSV